MASQMVQERERGHCEGTGCVAWWQGSGTTTVQCCGTGQGTEQTLLDFLLATAHYYMATAPAYLQHGPKRPVPANGRTAVRPTIQVWNMSQGTHLLPTCSAAFMHPVPANGVVSMPRPRHANTQRPYTHIRHLLTCSAATRRPVPASGLPVAYPARIICRSRTLRLASAGAGRCSSISSAGVQGRCSSRRGRDRPAGHHEGEEEAQEEEDGSAGAVEASGAASPPVPSSSVGEKEGEWEGGRDQGGGGSGVITAGWEEWVWGVEVWGDGATFCGHGPSTDYTICRIDTFRRGLLARR